MGTNLRRTIAVLLLVFLLAFGLSGCKKSGSDLIIGGKNFTEQYIIAEMLGILIEENTDLKVEVKTGFANKVLFDALRAGDIDIVMDYTGTGLVNLGLELIHDPIEVYEKVKTEYNEKYNIKWLKPLGFNNTYAMVLRSDVAQDLGLNTISDLAEVANEMVIGCTPVFAERYDGLLGVQEHYGFTFKNVRSMDAALMYQAVAQGNVDVISGFNTEGRIPAFELKVLEDDQNFFPPYDAAPIIRGEVLEEHPELEDILNKLSGLINDEEMAVLNAEVDVEKREPAAVAREFLQKEGLI